MGIYFATGLPLFAFLVNIAAGIIQTRSILAHLTSFENSLYARFDSLETRFARREHSL
jgi:hypothetical protein